MGRKKKENYGRGKKEQLRGVYGVYLMRLRPGRRGS